MGSGLKDWQGFRVEPIISIFANNYMQYDFLTICQISDMDHCQFKADNDTVPGSIFLWFDTLAGHEDTRPCPRGSAGEYIKREIIQFEYLSTTSQLLFKMA